MFCPFTIFLIQNFYSYARKKGQYCKKSLFRATHCYILPNK
ncbi:hypothetical protein CpecA_0735 [Chlamydia pecorum IPTaLE]|nr:hypothetical protein CpecA_0735 [Chlamydia pecorum IPTaLE]